MSSFSSRQTACAIPVVGNWGPSSSHTNISSSTYNNHSKSILLEAPERNTDTHTRTKENGKYHYHHLLICYTMIQQQEQLQHLLTKSNHILQFSSEWSLHMTLFTRYRPRDKRHTALKPFVLSCAHHPLCAVSLTRGCRVHYRVVAVVALTITVRWGAFLCSQRK